MENKEQAEIIFYVLTGCLGMLVLVAFIILFVVYYQKKVFAQQQQMQIAENKYQRELLSAAIQVEERERERIASNVHDDMGLLLHIIKKNQTDILNAGDNTELTKNLGSKNLDLLEAAIERMRSITKDLKPPALIKMGYFNALNQLCKDINNSGGVKINFFRSDFTTRFTEQTELQLYRITQELLNNISKHAQPKEIAIEFKKFNSGYNLIIFHDGKGITSQQVQELLKQENGLGLKSIQSRAQFINAVVEYTVKNKDVSYITVALPLID